MDRGVAIVGSGHAGVQAAASLREEGYDGPVVLIGDEADLPYHKPPLSKTFIKEADAHPQILRSEGFYASAGIDLRLGVGVSAIDRAAGRLDLMRGPPVAFDRLILATGARPRQLVLDGGPLEGVVSLRSLGDGRALRALAAQAQDVLVLGGGFIGLEIAATLAAIGRRVTVVEAQDRLLGRSVAPPIAAHVLRRLGGTGVRIMPATTIARLDGHAGHVSGAVTSAGERIAATLVVVGIGVVPNVELAVAAGLDIANGIRVDPLLRTSQPEILAIGDVAGYRHWSSNAEVRLESVQNAADHGRSAARTIVGHGAPYAAVPWFWSDIGDMKLQMVGLTARSDSTVVSGDPAENRFSVFHFLGDRLIGIESVNRPADHMLGRKMMAAGFSPGSDVVLQGSLKDAFARWQEMQPREGAG